MIRLKCKLKSLILFLTAFSVQAETLSISAAASLAPSLEHVVKLYNQVNTKDTVVFNYGASSILARQIQYGAPADIYLSANEKWISFLKTENKLIIKSIKPFIANQLVIAENNKSIKKSSQQSCYDQKSTLDLIQRLNKSDQKIVVAEMTHVPLGIYSKQVLIRSGQFEVLQKNLVPSANARSALAFIEQEWAKFAFLYYSDAIKSDLVDIVCIIPSDFHDSINYYLAKVSPQFKPSKDKGIAIQRFYQFLQNDSVKRVFVENGFLEYQ